MNMRDKDGDQMYTLVVENLPFLEGAIGVDSANIIIYTGAYAFPVPVNRTVAFTDRPGLGSPTAAHYRLCVFEHSSFSLNNGGRDNGAIGQLVLDWYTNATNEPLGAPAGSFKWAEMHGESPFRLRMEHTGDAIFIDNNGKYTFDISGYNAIYDPDLEDHARGELGY